MALGGLIIFLTPGEFWRDDSQSGVMPAFVEMHRGLQEGSIPLVSSTSWVAGQFSIMSVFDMGVLLLAFKLGLPLAQTANAIIEIGKSVV